MSDNKKYYYLKLKDDFFDSDEIKILESMDNGYIYSNILLKMYLKSIKREGLLVFNERIPYNPKMIATVTNHNINDVKQALVLFQEMGMMEILSNGAIYMLDIQNYIGKSTTEADRIRAYRNKIEEKKDKLLSGDRVELLDVCTNVQQMNDKCTPEIEIEIDKEIDIEIDKRLLQDKEEKKSSSSSLEMDEDIKLIVKEYQRCGFGSMDLRTKELLEELLEEYSIEWITESFKICVDSNKRNLKYARGILNNWKNDGGMNLGGKENGQTISGDSGQDNGDAGSAERAGVLSL